MDRAARYGQVGMALLATAFFVLGFDLATAAGGLLPETYVILLVIYMTVGIVMGWLRISCALERLWRVPLLTLSALGYLGADLISALYSPDQSIVWQKYRVVVGLCALAAAVLFLGVTQERLDSLMLAFGGAAAVAALAAWLGRLWPDLYPVYYRLRLSPRADYNMFATALMSGLICGGCVLSLGRIRMRSAMRAACFFLLGAAVVPAVFLSGSRRTYLLLLPVTAMLAFCWLSAGGPYKMGLKGVGGRFVLLIILAAICVLGAAGGRQVMELSQVSPIAFGNEGPPATETAALWRYTSVDVGGLMTKRLGIYSVAIDELRAYEAGELVFGRGLGANIRLYDRPDERISALYPNAEARAGNLSAHNMLLADMLDGGAVKALALLLLLGAVAGSVIKLLWLDTRRGLPYMMALGLAVVGSLVSNRFGLLYDRYFVLLGAMLIMEMGMLEQDEKGGHVKQLAQA